MNIKITSKEAVSYYDHLSNHNSRFYSMAYDVACHRYFFLFFFFVPLWCYQLKKHVSLQNSIFIQTESGWFLCWHLCHCDDGRYLCSDQLSLPFPGLTLGQTCWWIFFFFFHSNMQRTLCFHENYPVVYAPHVGQYILLLWVIQSIS